MEFAMRGVFFGLEYDNDKVPNAVVIPGTRSGKFIKWVSEYLPKQIHRGDGKTVLRERRVVQCPMGFKLRKDEILGEMKVNKTESWQDAKFFVVEAHTIGVHIHPVKAKMEQAEKERKDAEAARQHAEKVSGDATRDGGKVLEGKEPSLVTDGGNPSEVVARVENAAKAEGVAATG